MFRCSVCLYSASHPFGISDKGGVCSGCINHEEKDLLKWNDRYTKLCTLIKQKTKKKGKYDCVVPVVGDAEDFYVLSKVIELKLNPLVVCVNDYFKNDIGWHNLHQLITYFDVDSIVFNPDMRDYKELIRSSLRKYDHLYLPFLQLHTAFPVHVAFDRKIPLVIWGQNQATEQVGKFSHLDAVQMSRWSRREHDVLGVEVDELIGTGAQLNERNLNYYRYPSPLSLVGERVTGIYLSNYLRWDPLNQNRSTIKYGFHPQTNSSSYDIYERAGSSVYYHLHDLLKLKRVGYRKVTDHLSRDIRHGRISYQAAVKVEEIFAKSKVDIKPFFDWLGVSNTGYEWYVKHKLRGFEHLLMEESSAPDAKVVLPPEISELLGVSHRPRVEFVLFGKGI